MRAVSSTPALSSNLASIQDLPPEVFESVVSQLDRPDLLSCHSVCGTWSNIVGPYLFSTLRLSSAQQLHDFTNYVEAHQGIGRLVQHLTLKPDDKYFIIEVPVDDVFRLAHVLPRLEDLDLCWVKIVEPFSGHLGLRPLRSLKLRSRGWRPHLLPLLHLLSLFDIQTLHLRYLPVDSAALVKDDPKRPNPLHIRNLHLRTDPYTSLPSMSDLLEPGTLSTFEATWMDEDQSEAIGSFLDIHGSGVTRLMLRTEGENDWADVLHEVQCELLLPRHFIMCSTSHWQFADGRFVLTGAAAVEALNLAACTRLIKFETSIPHWSLHYDNAQEDLETYTALIRALPPSVEVVEMYMAAFDGSKHAVADFSRLDAAFMDLPHLTCVVLTVRPNVRSSACGFLMGRFPQLKRAGRIDVRQHPGRTRW